MSRYVLIGVIILLQACAPPVYYARQIHGQVADAQTGEPIEGAIVVAQWIMFRRGLFVESLPNQRLRVFETVTDQNGQYIIPGGPMIRVIPLTELLNRDPEILVLKKGYAPEAVSNEVERSGFIRTSEWNGKVIKLKKPKGNLIEQARRLRILSSGLETGDVREYPRIVLALDAEERRLKRLGLDTSKYNATVFNQEHVEQARRALLRRDER